MKNRGLGRGLDALLSNEGDNVSSKIETTNVMPLSQLTPGKFQPRKNFNQDSLKELAESIKAQGIIQPILVRMTSSNQFEIIAGERRWQAAKIAKLDEVPIVLKDISDSTALAMALIENIQREDLNPIEVGLSYQRLIDECDLTQEQLSHKISKSRSSIANHLRLLKLPVDIQIGVKGKKITMGHARALVSAGDEATQVALYHRVVQERLSVRDIESILRGEHVTAPIVRAKDQKREKIKLSDSEYTFKNDFGDQLSTKVEITKTSNGNGKIIVNFNSEIDLSRIIDLLNSK